MPSQAPGFAAKMYGIEDRNNPIPRQQLFSPLKTTDIQTGKRYVSWKTEETGDAFFEAIIIWPKAESFRDNTI